MKRGVQRKEIIGFDTLFTPDGSGYVVTVPLLPDLATEGDTLTEAHAMAKEAILCYLEGVLKDMAPAGGKRQTRQLSFLKT